MKTAYSFKDCILYKIHVGELVKHNQYLLYLMLLPEAIQTSIFISIVQLVFFSTVFIHIYTWL